MKKRKTPDKTRVPDEVHEAFYSATRSIRFPLAVNDVVTVSKGRRPGEKAAVISIQAIEPSVAYLVEYGDGSDDVVPLENLKPEDAS